MWVSWIGSHRCENKFTIGVQPRANTSVHRSLEFGNRSVQIDKNLHLVAAGKQRFSIDAIEVDKQEFLGKREVFAKSETWRSYVPAR